MSPFVRLSVLAVILATAAVCSYTLLAAPQQTDPKAEAQQLLLEASQFIRDIPEDQQPSAAANIASLLVRSGDLPDALTTARLPKKADGQALAMRSVVWQLADEGSFTQAIALAESSGDRQAKDETYDILAGSLAEKGNVKGALQIVHRIQNDPIRLVEALLRVASHQGDAGDRTGAQEVMREAIKATEEGAKENLSCTLELLQVARRQAANGNKSDAFITLNQFSEIAHEYKQTEGANHFLEQLAGARAELGDISGAEQAVEENSAGDNDFALMIISQEQAKLGLMVDALESARRISSLGFKTSALREIAMIQGTHGTLNDALEALNLISDPNRRAEAIATLALEQAENNNPAARVTLQVAWNRAREPNADSPISVLTIVAVTRALLHDFVGAQQIVDDMANSESRVWPLWNMTSMLAHQGHKEEALALAHDEVAPYPKTYALLGTAQGILNRADEEEHSHIKKQ
jgi:tetratricopeptide (TPR) repeat protein